MTLLERNFATQMRGERQRERERVREPNKEKEQKKRKKASKPVQCKMKSYLQKQYTTAEISLIGFAHSVNAQNNICLV